MESSLQKIIAAVVGVMILFIIPVYIAYEKVDDISYSLALKLTQNFVDNARDKGYISPEMYSDFVSGLYSTNNVYEVTIEHTKKRYDPAIYIYEKKSDNTKGKVLYVLDYDRYLTASGELPTSITLNGITYNSSNYIIEKAHKVNEEIVTDKQIVNQIFRNTSISKVDFLRNCMLGNVDMYKSLAYMNENSYVMNEGDKINVVVKNKNKTIASIFYSMFTANVGTDDISRIYINYGGTVRNSGENIISDESGLVTSELGKIFKYTGKAEEISLAPGRYQIEAWGASGGGYETDSTTTGGAGSYVKGVFDITKQTMLYVYVGGKGTEYSDDNENNGGYNGGGNSYNGYGGGGASDVRIIKGEYNDTVSLLSRILVAAGGGGSSKKNSSNSYGQGGVGGNLSVGFDGQSAGVNQLLVGLGAKRNTISVGYETYTLEDGTVKSIPENEKGSLGLGGSVDFDGAGGGGGGYFGGSASHNEFAGGGGGICFVYKNEMNIINGTKLPLKAIFEGVYESKIINDLKAYVDEDGTWEGIKLVEYEVRNGIDNGIRNPLEYTGTSYMTGNVGNGIVIIKKID